MNGKKARALRKAALAEAKLSVVSPEWKQETRRTVYPPNSKLGSTVMGLNSECVQARYRKKKQELKDKKINN